MATAPLKIKSEPKPTVWHVDPRTPTGKALAKFVGNTAKIKLLKADADAANAVLKEHFEACWLDHIRETGELPPTPIKLLGNGGVTATFVVQDRTGSAAIDEDVFEAIAETIDREQLHDMTIETESFKFDPNVLAEPSLYAETTVLDHVIPRLQAMAKAMAKAKEITREQADALVSITTDRHFKAAFLDSLPALCGGSAAKFADVVGKLSSAIVRFVKA